MAEPRARMLQMFGLLGAGLPSSSDLDTSALYRSGRMDAMAGGPTRGEFMDTQQQKVANVALGLLGAIEPVWHGSPHKFSKFDLSKIGTGEGAQAYGHGAYLAESPGVAKSYQQMSTAYDFDIAVNAIWDDLLKRSIFDDGTITWGPNRTKVTREQFKKIYELNPDLVWSRLGPEQRTAIEKALSGNLYESRLRWPDPAREAADPLGPQHFLDWDKPLSTEVEDKLRKSLNLDAWLNHVKTPDAKWGDLSNIPVTGSEIYREAVRQADPVAVNKAFVDAGIPGIRYLDAGSRAGGQGTHNYVVFDDALIEILKRNGVPVEGLLE